ncbi:MerR family transcriptional regulator [Microlunatus antarcticus]|uniref:DNA-binding transcriptional MerR regulator n=1 Tax=Microlunatus antarcticus TaxID=53388 RepID=A0A7W5JV09_9ACTN|nr:DNA-binding transcriptional MerR regulator [Microlunatus antarcticus]
MTDGAPGAHVSSRPADQHPVQMQIGQVAELTEVSVRTLRHWEEAGLVTPSARSTGGFRLYTADDVARLRTIRRMKPLGFTLDEMKQMLVSLDVLDDPTATPEARAAAVAFVVDCHARAVESCSTLRRQLAYAEEFRDLLATRGRRD